MRNHKHDCVYTSSFSLEATAAKATATTIFLFTKHIIFLYHIIFNRRCCLCETIQTLWLLNLKLMCLVEVRNWIKRDGEDVSQQCWKEPMPKEQKKNQIKQFLFCEWAQWTHDWYYSSQGKRASESHTDGKGKIKEIDKKTRLWIMAVFNLVLWLTEKYRVHTEMLGFKYVMCCWLACSKMKYIFDHSNGLNGNRAEEKKRSAWQNQRQRFLYAYAFNENRMK